MKKKLVYLTLTIIFLMPGISSAQSFGDSTGRGRHRQQGVKEFLDKNANGVDDRQERMGGMKKQQRMRDQFIDKDGDGICDDRASGMGLRMRKGDGKKMHQGQNPKQ
jgi:hypothetical protein